MKTRLILLIFVLLVRLTPGFIGSLAYENGQKLSVKGNIVKVDQTQTECIVQASYFWMKVAGKCSFSHTERGRLIGIVRVNLTDRILGRVYLDDGQIIIAESGLESDHVELSWGDQILKSWREKLTGVYKANLPEPEASLVAGIVLGVKSGLPADFYEALIDSGTVHMVVASGYNVMALGGMLLGLCLWLCRRRMATVLTIAGIMIYGMIAGMQAPIIRAIIMGSLIFISSVLGRRSSGLWSLCLAGFAMVIWEPLLIESVSFQLTMAAALGVFWLEPILSRHVAEIKWWPLAIMARTELTPTLSAMALTTPIIWWHFARVSLVAPISNVLILPLVPPLMAMGGMMLIVSLLTPFLAVIAVWPTYALAHLIVVLVEVFGG